MAMVGESMVDRITRVLRDLGGEGQLKDIRSRLLQELGEPNSSRSRHYQTISLTIRQHSEGRGSDRFEKVGVGRYRLKGPWLGQSRVSDGG
jgi:hypothetical protein